MKDKLNIGILGNGYIVKNEYLPYLRKRLQERDDVNIAWIGCCLSRRNSGTKGIPRSETWGLGSLRGKLDNVDCVLISLPNFLHHRAAKICLENGIPCSIDKPITTRAKECKELVKIANARNIPFTVNSQRRYEPLYRKMKDLVDRGMIGDIISVNYLLSHAFIGGGRNGWREDRVKSGGGVLLSTGWHVIDVILWLCSGMAKGYRPVAVNAVDEGANKTGQVERFASFRIGFQNGAAFNCTLFQDAPAGSVDEEIVIYGRSGTIRMSRRILERRVGDLSAGNLVYQRQNGHVTRFADEEWSAKRWAPFDDFVGACINREGGRHWAVGSPASDGYRTISIIESAYESIAKGGIDIRL
jgi:predicted dehydrogenase